MGMATLDAASIWDTRRFSGKWGVLLMVSGLIPDCVMHLWLNFMEWDLQTASSEADKHGG